MDKKIETVWLKSKKERNNLIEFLNRFSFAFEENIDYSLIIKDEKNKIIASCSKSKNIIKCLAIDNNYQGQGISSMLVNKIIDKIFEEGFSHFFAFTLNKNIEIFDSLGFNKIFSTDFVTLFENGVYKISDYLNNIYKKHSMNEGEKGALVMNCNPMTLGHLHLINYACENTKEVLLFVVEEDKSLFPFKDRINIIKKATEGIKNLKIIESGEYIISSATFPTYFLKKMDEKIKIYTEMDIGIFGEYFAPKFNIKKRYVGREPFDDVTSTYNAAMKDILPSYGVDVVEIDRLIINDNIVSASYIRKLIYDDKLCEAYKYLPEATIEFLNSNDGIEIIDRIKNGKLID